MATKHVSKGHITAMWLNILPCGVSFHSTTSVTLTVDLLTSGHLWHHYQGQGCARKSLCSALPLLKFTASGLVGIRSPRALEASVKAVPGPPFSPYHRSDTLRPNGFSHHDYRRRGGERNGIQATTLRRPRSKVACTKAKGR